MHRKPEYRALTLNIHKGFSASNLRYTLEALRVVLRDSKCNVVFLQEVSGENSRYYKRIKGWPNTDQLEYLADSVWPHFAYGRNAATPLGHHGNAILSVTPIGHVHNEDLSLHRLSQRGLLHVTLEEGTELLNVHLGLFERERNRQHRSAQPSPKFRARPRTLLFRMQRMARSLLPLAIRRVSLVRPSSTGDETLFSAFTRRFSVAFLALSLSADDTHRYRLSFKSGIDMNQLPAATKM